MAARKAGTRRHETRPRPTRCPLGTRASLPRPKQCPLEPHPARPAFGKGPLGTRVVPNGPKRCPLRANGRHLGHRQGNLTPRLHHLLRSSAISLRDCAKRYEGVCFPQRGKARYGPTGCPIRSKTTHCGPTGCFRGVNAAANLGCNKTPRNEPAPAKKQTPRRDQQAGPLC